MAWRLARSLVSLRAQVDALAPRRSKASDGTIGDPDHASRVSDHNPDEFGVVRAIDLTDDPQGGLDALWLREALRDSRDPRIKYLISEGEICGPVRVSGYPAWAWRPYLGANGHFHHLHISVQPGDLGDIAGTWNLARDFGAPVRPIPDVPEDDMTPEQAAALARADENAAETRRLLAALLTETGAKGPEANLILRLRGIDENAAEARRLAGLAAAVRASDPDLIAAVVVDSLGTDLAAQVAQRLTVTVKEP